MQFPYWEYFLVLCEDVKRTARFVEPSPENFKTFSIEFARLYLAIGSEIDVIAKLLCRKIHPKAKLDGINTYRPTLLGKYPEVPSIETVVPRSGITLAPWADWAKGRNPKWWQSYNDVKHERNDNFTAANLGNTLNSLAGLLVLLGYYHAEDLRDSNVGLTQESLIRFDRKYLSTSKSLVQTGFRLPGIPPNPSLLKMFEEAEARRKLTNTSTTSTIIEK